MTAHERLRAEIAAKVCHSLACSCDQERVADAILRACLEEIDDGRLWVPMSDLRAIFQGSGKAKP